MRAPGPATMHRNIQHLPIAAAARRYRLFLALLPDEEVRAALAQTALAAGVTGKEGMRAVDARRYHATLHFLGEHAEPRPELVAAVERIGDGLQGAAFEWTLDRLRSFHGRRSPRVLVGSRLPDRLRSLWADWRDALRRELPELALDARCVPHVTLGYGDAMWPEAAVAPLCWTASELALLESRAGERDYRRLAGWSLSPD